MPGFDLLYKNMHHDVSKTPESKEKTENILKRLPATEGQNSQEAESSQNPIWALFSKLF